MTGPGMTTPAQTILIVEDTPSLRLTYVSQLAPLGHRLIEAATGAEGLAALRREPVDAMLLDLSLPDMDGLDLLTETRTWPNPPTVVVITANASLATAVQAVRQGAFDYLVKPFAAARLITTVQNALAQIALHREVNTLRRTVESATFGDFIGRSLPMQTVYRVIEAAAPSTASVFITGESGTGKELAAAALHRASPRHTGPFIALNCGTIPRDLMESSIFGHIKGAFTGATADQPGAAAQADGGTLFLDELGEMDPQLQTKLLRFIQTGAYQRVGESRTRQADIRFVAATNRDPEEAIRTGRLREDLFYRLNVIPLHMPPLRARGENILLIARHALARFAAAEGKSFQRLAPETEARLIAHPWPGNVRQLQNVIRNAVILHDAEVVTPDMLPALGRHAPPDEAAPSPPPPRPEASPTIEPLAVVERRTIERAIALCGGNIQLAARRLGINPSTIYRKKDAWDRAG